MPTIRPENLPRVMASFAGAEEFFDYTVVVILDDDWARRNYTKLEVEQGYRQLVVRADIPGQYGERNLNEGMKYVQPEDWVWFHADDNLVTPGFFKSLREQVDMGAEICVYPMNIGIGMYLRSVPGSMRAGGADQSQIALKACYIKDRWEEGPTPDGVWIEKLYARFGDKFRFVQEPALRYNALR